MPILFLAQSKSKIESMIGLQKKKFMKILDLTAGNRAIWYRKDHPLATYLDKREYVKPDVVCDIRSLPEEIHRASPFDLIVFDPPHMNCGPNSNMSKTYGYHTTKEIFETIQEGSHQAWLVCKQNGLMAFKWNDHDIPLKKVLKLMPDWEPLFGHLTKNGPGSQTYWVMLRRL